MRRHRDNVSQDFISPAFVSIVLLLSSGSCGDDGASTVCDPAQQSCSDAAVDENDAGQGADARTQDAGAIAGTWSSPISLVDNIGRLAIGNQLHIVGHKDGQLIHRTSIDQGESFLPATILGNASAYFPAMYGGLHAQGNNVYLITGADGDLASGPRQLDFWKSGDNGTSFSQPLRITAPAVPVYRARIAVNENYIHVIGTGAPTPQGSVWYYRSTDGGDTWEDGIALASDLGPYGGGQTIAVDGATVHVPFTRAENGAGGGPSLYIRSSDNGATWSQPIEIGEDTAESDRQARVQIAAVDGKVFACWQREGAFTGDVLPADRLGYNTSSDGGQTWGTARVVPENTGINRNHQQLWMASGGGVHLLWRHGDSDSDAAGYMYSPDYGASWQAGMIAIDTPAANHPFSMVANASAVHILTAPSGEMLYARRPLR